METPSQDEKYSGRDARGEGPSANNTNVSGPEPTRRGANTANFSGCGLEPNSAVSPTPRGVNAASLNDSRSGPEPPRFRASDDAYAQWTAEGKPNCMTCGKRHPPPCHAPLRHKRQAEEPAESSTTRASGRRRRAVPRDQRAPTRKSLAPTQAASTPVHAAPATMDSSLAPQMAPPPRVGRTPWQIMHTSPEATDHGLTTLGDLVEGLPTAELRRHALSTMFQYRPRDQDPGPPPQGESQEDIE